MHCWIPVAGNKPKAAHGRLCFLDLLAPPLIPSFPSLISPIYDNLSLICLATPGLLYHRLPIPVNNHLLTSHISLSPYTNTPSSSLCSPICPTGDLHLGRRCRPLASPSLATTAHTHPLAPSLSSLLTFVFSLFHYILSPRSTNDASYFDRQCVVPNTYSTTTLEP